MYCWVEYPQTTHQENCECCRCIQIPQKPYEECVCDDTQQVETNKNPLIYHHYYQTPCTVCGRTHYQQSTSVCGILPLECECADMSSFFSSGPRLSSFSNKTDQLSSKKSVQYADNCSTLQDPRKSSLLRNDDGFFPPPPSKKSLGLQTCKSTGVGDCPACLGARTSCHQSECQLCCEPKTCGPDYSKCPFAPAIEVQTDPICEFSELPCRCSGRDPCGLPPCGVAENCEYSDIECRCPNKSCNLKGSCIIIDEGDEDFYHFSQINCDCADIGCDTSGNCIEFDNICECGPQPFEVYNTGDEEYDGQDFYETYGNSQGIFDDFPSKSISCQADSSVPPALSPSKLQTQQQMQMAVANVLGRQSVAQRKSCAADTPLFAARQSMGVQPSMMRKSTSAGPWVDPVMRQSVSPNMRQSVAPSMRQSMAQNMRQSMAPSMRQSMAPNMRQSVAPSMRMSLAPNMRQSVAPSMRQSMAPSMRQSMAPSMMRQSVAPSMRQSMAPDVFGAAQSVMGQSFMSGMDGFPAIVPRRYCAQAKYVGPGADEIPMDSLSGGSQRHSAFGEEPIYSNLDIMRQLMEPPTTDYTESDDDTLLGCGADAELQTGDDSNAYVLNAGGEDGDDGDGVYEVIIDQVPNENGTTNRISIVSSGTKEKPNPGSANVTKATSCSKLQATKSDVSTQIRDARTSPQPHQQGSKMNQAVTSMTKMPRAHNQPQRTASTKSLLKPSPSNRSIDPTKPKSQVHFDINILDANNANRMIVLRRSISQQTKQ